MWNEERKEQSQGGIKETCRCFCRARGIEADKLTLRKREEARKKKRSRIGEIADTRLSLLVGQDLLARALELQNHWFAYKPNDEFDELLYLMACLRQELRVNTGGAVVIRRTAKFSALVTCMRCE